LNAFILAAAVTTDLEDKSLREAFDIVVRRYYDEYSDATELDGDFYNSLKTVFDLCFPFAEEDEFDEIVVKKDTSQ
jgi:hypothetical protein